MNFIPAELIKKKRRGQAHSDEEILFLINAYARDEVPDYQMSAWLMAVCFQGMNGQETATLTRAMRDSGRILNFPGLPTVDKHSTGGVGDKASMILAPIAAAAGVPVPMIAGRGLGHTGGTLDKLESIPGFNVNLTLDQFQNQVQQVGLAIMGQTKDICPADKKLYALRDVTGTVDSLPLICGSIMSKKLAEGIQGLILDVKFGSGAFMKSLDDARKLAILLKQTGDQNGVRTSALLTNMNQPLGRFIGNSLEIKECLDILQGKNFEEQGVDTYADTRELSLELAAHMILLAEKAPSIEEARRLAEKSLKDGSAFNKFMEVCEHQGQADISNIPFTHHKMEILASQSGFITGLDTERIGVSAIALGAGRKASSDSLDYTAGIEMHKKFGQKIAQGEVVFTIYASEPSRLENARPILESAMTISETEPEKIPLIAQVIN